MMKFAVPPEYCLILNAFNQTNSLRAAAALLQVDPPSLVRKVQKISAEFGYLQKVGNRWALSEAGRHLAIWTQSALQSQQEFIHEDPVLRISSFGWLAEESLIPGFPRLQELLKHKQPCRIKLTAVNHEQELLQGRTDFVIQGHAPTDPTIAYKKVSSYKWVAVAPLTWKKSFAGLDKNQRVELLKTRPFIRHQDFNPETALGFQPETLAAISVDAVIGIRAAILTGQGWSVLPTMAVHRLVDDHQLIDLQLPTFIQDDVSVWWIRARKDLTESARILTKWMSEIGPASRGS